MSYLPLIDLKNGFWPVVHLLYGISEWNFTDMLIIKGYILWLSDFIWPFLRPYMGVIPNPKMAFIFPISCILALIFPILIKYFPKCVGKGSFPKSQIKSLWLRIFTLTFPVHELSTLDWSEKWFLTCSSFTIWNIWMKLHRYVEHQRLHIFSKDRHPYLSSSWVIRPWLIWKMVFDL